MTSTTTPKLLNHAAVAALLGVSRLKLWWWIKAEFFAEPTTVTGGKRAWDTKAVYTWALSKPALQLTRRVPLTYWPQPTQAATLSTARELRDNATAQIWYTTTGSIAVIWSAPGGMLPTFTELADQLPDIDALVRVDVDFSFAGPSLDAATPAAPEDRYYISWPDLSHIIGRPLPYWPLRLRDPQLITDWTPETLTVPAPTIPDIDSHALLRLAVLLPEDSPAPPVLINLVHTDQSMGRSSAQQDIDIINDHVTDPQIRKTIAIAATPIPGPDTSLDDIDPTQRRLAWKEILRRSDTLAARCITQAMQWNGGRDFPHSYRTKIDTTTAAGSEWAERLQPTPWTAAFQILGAPRHATTLIDPKTDAPVLRLNDTTLLTAHPQRLPTTSPLTEVILDNPIWVRTSDGTLYPAPHHNYYGLSWGYRGSGPATLAVLIDRLLNDITSEPADHLNGPTGLRELLETNYEPETILTRAQLEDARNNGHH